MPKKGYKRPQKDKDKISKSMMGKQNSKGKQNRLGYKASIETKLLQSIAKRGKHMSPSTEFKKGCRPFNWNGGRSNVSKRRQGKAYFDYIYNDWFKGSALHHMRYESPVIGIYIPKELHQLHTHNIKEANVTALKWYIKQGGDTVGGKYRGQSKICFKGL
jgi:hypothetical protein